MSAETALATLLRINLIAAAAIALVLVLRPLTLRFLGAGSAYRLWLVVPLAVAAAFLPARTLPYVPRSAQLSATFTEQALPAAEQLSALQRATDFVVKTPLADKPTFAQLVLGIWLFVGVSLLLISIIRTRGLAADARLGPSLVGVLRPKLVLPRDFETRFDARERELILAHEEVHRTSRHTLVNALVELLRCANWFNPLGHVAATCLRVDQELACDAAVIAARPGERRAYAEALLKMRLSPRQLPLGCTWTSRSAKRLGQRIKLLAQPSATWRSVLGGATAVLLLSLGLGYAAWAQQEPNVARPESLWTAVGDKWQGLLSHQLEAKRHDSFIKRAQQGNIDLVFFGTTDTEMFSWPDRGRPEFERAFANIHAANFGSQGTSPNSLLWRMQHGELDGYEAKLIVFQFWGIGDLVNHDDEERLKGLAPLLAEIKARQPRARILLSAPFPRGFNSRDAWARISAERAMRLAHHVDNQKVFYTDIGARFYKSDGAHDTSLWSRSYVADTGVGAQPNAFKVWTEELQPWLDRFVR